MHFLDFESTTAPARMSL